VAADRARSRPARAALSSRGTGDFRDVQEVCLRRDAPIGSVARHRIRPPPAASRSGYRGRTPADSEFAYLTKRAAFSEYVEKVWGWDEEAQRRLHEQRFTAQECRVINLAGTDVGIMAVAVAPGCVRVNQLFLVPEHQGKGIGRKCMLLVINEARQLGLPIRLRVLKVNPRALTFYQRLGFVRTGETDTHVLMETA